jgi:mannosyl-oligosaccharide glucosidase
MAGYGWEQYDPRHGGTQTIHDAGNQLDITTSFTKTSDGKWGVRISGKPREDAPSDLKSTVIFYAFVEGSGLSRLDVQDADTDDAKHGFDAERDVVIEGENPNIREFKMTITGDKGTSNKHPIHGHASASDQPLDRTLVRSAMLPDDALWQTKRECLPKPSRQRRQQLCSSRSAD